MATTKKSAGKKKKSGGTAKRQLVAETPITIGPGSFFLDFKHGDFDQSGSTHNHKNPNAAITHLTIVSAELPGKILDMIVKKPMSIVVLYK